MHLAAGFGWFDHEYKADLKVILTKSAICQHTAQAPAGQIAGRIASHHGAALGKLRVFQPRLYFQRPALSVKCGNLGLVSSRCSPIFPGNTMSNPHDPS
jgi:hypothetical protein